MLSISLVLIYVCPGFSIITGTLMVLPSSLFRLELVCVGSISGLSFWVFITTPLLDYTPIENRTFHQIRSPVYFYWIGGRPVEVDQLGPSDHYSDTVRDMFYLLYLLSCKRYIEVLEPASCRYKQPIYSVTAVLPRLRLGLAGRERWVKWMEGCCQAFKRISFVNIFRQVTWHQNSWKRFLLHIVWWESMK